MIGACQTKKVKKEKEVTIKKRYLILIHGGWQFSCSVVSNSFQPHGLVHQVPLSMGFLGQEYWSGLPFPSPGDLPDPGIELGLLHCRQILYQLSHQAYP